MNSKYLCFEELEAKTKTKQFAVQNTSGFILGRVKWYAPWRRFCFFNTAVELVFDTGCLAEIKDFITKLMSERKEETQLGIIPDSIFEEIRAERRRQDEKFGEQNHPMLGKKRLFSTRNKEYPEKSVLKSQLELTRERIQEAEYGWFDILCEEICEAFLETEPKKQREEMIQVAAVAIAIIECLDRRKPE